MKDHYWLSDGKCYQHYEQGPCKSDEQFRKHPAKQHGAICILWGQNYLSYGWYFIIVSSQIVEKYYSATKFFAVADIYELTQIFLLHINLYNLYTTNTWILMMSWWINVIGLLKFLICSFWHELEKVFRRCLRTKSFQI